MTEAQRAYLASLEGAGVPVGGKVDTDGDDKGPGIGRAFLHGVQYDTPEALIYRYGKGMQLQPTEDDYNVAEQVARGIGGFASPSSIIAFIVGGGLGGGLAKKLGVDAIKGLVLKNVTKHALKQAGAVGIERMGRSAVEKAILEGDKDVISVLEHSLKEGGKGALLGFATGPAAALGPAGRTLQAATKGSRKGAASALTAKSAELAPKISLRANPSGVASRLVETNRVGNAARRGLQAGTEGAIFGAGGPMLEGRTPTGDDLGVGIGTMLTLGAGGALLGRARGTHGKALGALKDVREGRKLKGQKVHSDKLDALLAIEPEMTTPDATGRRRLPPETRLDRNPNDVPPPRGTKWTMDRSVLERPAEFGGELQNIVTEFQVWGARTGRLRPDQVRFLDKLANDSAGWKWLNEGDASRLKQRIVEEFGIQRWRQFLLDNKLRPDELQKGADHLYGELPLPEQHLPNRYDKRFDLTREETRADNQRIMDEVYTNEFLNPPPAQNTAKPRSLGAKEARKRGLKPDVLVDADGNVVKAKPRVNQLGEATPLEGMEPQRTPIEQAQVAVDAVPPKADGSVDMEARQRVLDEWKADPANAEAVREAEGEGQPRIFSEDERSRIAFDMKDAPQVDDSTPIVVEHTSTRQWLDRFMVEGIDATQPPPDSRLGRLTVQDDGSVRQASIDEAGLFVAPPRTLTAKESVVIVTPARDVQLTPEASGLGYETGIKGLYGAQDAFLRKAIPSEDVAGIKVYDSVGKSWKWIPNPQSPYADAFTVDRSGDLASRPSPLTLRPDGTLAADGVFRGGPESAAPRGKTALDVVQYERDDLGNTIQSVVSDDVLRNVPSEKTSWVASTREAAAEFGDVSKVDGGYRILAKDPDGGMLIERIPSPLTLRPDGTLEPRPVETGRTRTAEQMGALMSKAKLRNEEKQWREWADKHRNNPDRIDEAIRLMDESFEGSVGNTLKGTLGVIDALQSLTSKTGTKDTGILARQGNKLRTKAEKAYVKMVDDLHALRRFEEAVQKETGMALPAEMRPYLMGRLARSWSGRAANRIRLELDPILEGLSDVERGEFSSLLRAERILAKWDGVFEHNQELKAKGLTHGRLLHTSESLRPKYGKKLEAYKKMMTDLLNDSLGPERAAAILEKNSFYTPFFGEMEAAIMDRQTSNPKAYSSPDFIYTLEGKGNIFMDPLEATIKNIYMAERYKAHRNTVEALIELDRMVGGTDMIAPHKGPAKQGQRILEHWEGLERKQYEVDPHIYEAFINLDRKQMNALTKILGAPARTLRIGATSTPAFGVVNFFRDWWVNSIQSQYGFTPLDMIRGVTSVMRKDKWYNEFMQDGGAMSSLVAMDQAALKRALSKSEANTGKGGVGKAMYYLQHPIEFGRMFTEFSEAFNRVGAYRKARKHTGRLEAALEAREVTLDFSRAGTVGKHINSVVAFWNAQVQGLDKMRRVAQARPESFMARVAPIAISSMALALWNREDPRWKDIPDYEKQANWIFMIPGQDKIWKLPKPFDYGTLFGSIPELFVESTLSRNPDGASELWKMIESVTPSFNPLDISMINPLYEVGANKSRFKGRPIVPRSQEDLWPHLQYGRFTGRTSKEFTKGMAKIWGEENGYSPRHIEHLWKGYTGGLGRLAMEGVDAVWNKFSQPELQMGKKQVGDYPVARRFSVRHPSGGGEFVSNFYDLGYEARVALASSEETGERPPRWARRVDAIYGATRKRMVNYQKKIVRIDENTLMGGKAKNEAYDEVYEKINRTAERAYLRMLEARQED